jgi:hypothetical protein
LERTFSKDAHLKSWDGEMRCNVTDTIDGPPVGCMD